MKRSNSLSKNWSSLHRSCGKVANAVWKKFKQGAVSIKEAKIILQALKEIVEKVIKIEGELY